MRLQQRAGVYGLGALALAVGVIWLGTTIGVIRTASSGLNPGSPGTLSIALTDPPSVPDGVTKVYITYSDISVHVSGLGDSGWISTGAAGTLDTLGLVNFSQTVSSGSLPSGVYDLIRFNISSVTVNFNGKNYSATVESGELNVPIVGGLDLNSSTPAAALIDIQPVVLNLGDNTNPQFTISAGAKALQMPSSEVTTAVSHPGYKFSLSQRTWFRSFVENHADKVTISATSLTAGSFAFTLTNPTSDTITVRVVVLTPEPLGDHPSSFASSFVFVVEPDGSLEQLAMGTTAGSTQMALLSSGYQLGAGSSTPFSYSGTVNSMMLGSGIVAGMSYEMTVIGNHSLSTQTVTAS